jgi:hypothetical protein
MIQIHQLTKCKRLKNDDLAMIFTNLGHPIDTKNYCIVIYRDSVDDDVLRFSKSKDSAIYIDTQKIKHIGMIQKNVFHETFATTADFQHIIGQLSLKSCDILGEISCIDDAS